MRKTLLFIIVGVGTILAATLIPANALTFNLDSVFSGTAPAGDPPWLTATFEDLVPQEGTGFPQVQLTMSALNLSDDEFVSGWYFNFDPTVNISVSFDFPPTYVGGQSFDGFGRGPNNYKADGDSGDGFDILFSFETANNADERFTAGETSVYKFIGTGSAPLTAESFNFLNEAGNFYTAAHVQAIGENDGSGWIGATAAVPEPATILLLGTGLASLFGIRRFRFNKN